MSLNPIKRIKTISSNFLSLKQDEKASPKIVKMSLNRAKFDATVFYLGNRNGQKLAYIHAKTDSKFLEFERIKEFKNNDGIFPEVRYTNRDTMEVVVEWIDGNQLCHFDKPKDQQPVVTNSDMDNILKEIVKLHKRTSIEFNPLEAAPRAIKNTVFINMMLNKEFYYSLIVSWYREVYNSLNLGRNMKNLETSLLDDIGKLVRSGEEYLSMNIRRIALPSCFSLVHGDLHPENILKTKKGIKLIDFEHIHFGDRAAEMAFFFEQGSQSGYIDDSNREQILSSYLYFLEKNGGIIDRGFCERFNLMEVYTTYKFLGLLCGGYISNKKNNVNKILIDDVYQRAVNISNRLGI